jgi:hypothetical protein
MRSPFNSSYSLFDGAILSGNAKNKKGTTLFALCVTFLFFASVGLARAETPAPGWMLTATNYPSVLAPSGQGRVEIELYNVGAAPSHGSITVTDKLPPGITARGEAGAPVGEEKESDTIVPGIWNCKGNGGLPGEELVQGANEVTCTNDLANLPAMQGGGGVPSASVKEGGETVLPAISIPVDAPPGEATGLNEVSVSGGGAATTASTTAPIAVGSTPPSFAFTGWDSWFSKANGEIDDQAGSHPYEWTTSFSLSTLLGGSEGEPHKLLDAGGEPRDLLVKLPPGLIGNPQAVTQCTRTQFGDESSSGGRGFCPPSSIVGVASASFNQFTDVHFAVYNLVPPPGGPAELGFVLTGIDTFIDPAVRTGGDYGLDAHIDNIAQRGVIGGTLTLWGVPGDPSHDRWRQGSIYACNEDQVAKKECQGELPEPRDLKPFLTVPTSCDGPQPLPITANTWGAPVFEAAANVFSHDADQNPVGFTGCAVLPFAPSLSAAAATGAADSASGLDFDLHFDQAGLREPEALVEADLKDATVTFPAGLAVNPSEADGLQACSEEQAGFTGFKELDPSHEPGVSTPQFTAGPAECPEASKLGTVEVDTPLIGHPLLGGIYLARQGENPFGSLLAIYITVDDPLTGVVVKLPGEVKLDPVSGQISAVVDQDPQLPFEDFKIDLFGGSRAAFTTPATCGEFTTTSLMKPWSSPEGVDTSPSGSFEITEAAGGGACAPTPAQEPNAPSFSAGTFSPIAGTFSPFVLHLGRADGSQTLSALSATLPEGLLGKLAGVERCPQADIEAAEHRNGLGQGALEQASPSCPSGSELGVAHVGAGSGAPFYVTGHAYLGGPYEGAPFSVVVVTPAVAGPFDLGTVVVRSALFIDPNTAQVTVKSDPFPTILDGIPLDLRSIEVAITRPGFTLNPTSCEKTAVTGTITSTQGAGAGVSSPFQVGGCNGLPFKPSFTASASGKNSKADGSSLTVKIASKPEQEANIHSVDLTIPKGLPARLTTLQKACTAAQFEANPAGCPPASDIGTVVVRTPLLNAPLTGPAYLVSHGGAAFPDVEQVLQGEGVTVILDGKTQIKDGITYSRFDTVPDAPFTSFEFTAPQGPYSIFATNVPASAHYSLCGQNLVMPVTLTGQNGSPLKQETKIAVTGCPKAAVKTLTRAQKLEAALKQCRKQDKGRGKRRKREACERKAHKRYGPARPAQKSKHNKKKSKHNEKK